jgi:hypothetical protein
VSLLASPKKNKEGRQKKEKRQKKPKSLAPLTFPGARLAHRTSGCASGSPIESPDFQCVVLASKKKEGKKRNKKET